MNETLTSLVQPLAYRVWDPQRRSFYYTDVQPEAGSEVDRWTGLFDKQRLPLYENDIIRVHYNWKFGWIRAVIRRHAEKHEYRAEAACGDGTALYIGYYCFADAYRLGNLREHPGRLLPASEQFADQDAQPWWLSRAIFPATPGSCLN